MELGEGEDRRWVAVAGEAHWALHPRKAWHSWGSWVVTRFSCLCGICKHSDSVKTRHGTKAVCQLPHSEGGTPPFPLGFLSLQISVPANDFLGHVTPVLPKSCRETLKSRGMWIRENTELLERYSKYFNVHAVATL